MKSPTINRTPEETRQLVREREALCDWMKEPPRHKPMPMASREPKNTMPTREWTRGKERALRIIVAVVFTLLRPVVGLLTDPPVFPWSKRDTTPDDRCGNKRCVDYDRIAPGHCLWRSGTYRDCCDYRPTRE